MKSLDENYYNPFFSHIYVEEEIAEHPRVKQILARFMKAEIVYIRHYKDVFCRRRQDYEEQYHAQNLILAKKTGSLIYQGILQSDYNLIMGTITISVISVALTTFVIDLLYPFLDPRIRYS